MLLYFITTAANKLVIAKSDKGITNKNRVEKIEVRLKEMRDGDTVKQLLKLFVIAFNIEEIVPRHIFLTRLYTKFHELDADNAGIQHYFYNAWVKSLLKVCCMVAPEYVNTEAIKAIGGSHERKQKKTEQSKKPSLLTKSRRK